MLRMTKRSRVEQRRRSGIVSRCRTFDDRGMSAKKEARRLLTASLSLNKPGANSNEFEHRGKFVETRWRRVPRQVGPTGVEPARPCGHKALNLARLPIPPRALGVPAAPGDSRPPQPDSVVYLAPGQRQPNRRLPQCPPPSTTNIQPPASRPFSRGREPANPPPAAGLNGRCGMEAATAHRIDSQKKLAAEALPVSAHFASAVSAAGLVSSAGFSTADSSGFCSTAAGFSSIVCRSRHGFFASKLSNSACSSFDSSSTFS